MSDLLNILSALTAISRPAILLWYISPKLPLKRGRPSRVIFSSFKHSGYIPERSESSTRALMWRGLKLDAMG